MKRISELKQAVGHVAWLGLGTGILLCWTMVAPGWAQTGKAITAETALPPVPPTHTVVFPLRDVKRGMRGVAYTVFEGVDPEPMEVEILGVLNNALGPGQDMILARLHGTKPEYTGVVAGMSGSPVYIDGRIVGALSYRIGQFSKEPIAGITPIESMLEVRDGDDRIVRSQAKSGESATAKVETVSADVASVSYSPRRESGSNAITPIETPLVFSGFSQEAIDRFGDRFRALGMTPVAGLGGSDASAKQPEPLVPGSAVSAVLVRGDLTMSGTCTVTYIDATHLLACGHPITQFGRVSMPMTKATVLATLPSPLNAFKIINTTETVGAFTEDRTSAILGRFGTEARMIPVKVEVKGASGAKDKTVQFQILDNKELTPSAMLVSVYQSLQQSNGAAAEESYRLAGELSVAGEPTVKLGGIMAPNELNPAAINTALYVNDRFGRLYANSAEQPIVEGLQLRLETVGEHRTAAIEEVQASRKELRAGESFEVEATVHPYQAASRIVRIPVTIPANTPAGDLRLVVCDAASTDRLTIPQGGKNAVSLRDMVDQLNQSHANDRIYVTLLRHEAQAVVDGGTMPAVPLSMANVFEPLKSQQRLQLTGETAVELGSAETGYAVSGTEVLTIKVR